MPIVTSSLDRDRFINRICPLQNSFESFIVQYIDRSAFLCDTSHDGDCGKSVPPTGLRLQNEREHQHSAYHILVFYYVFVFTLFQKSYLGTLVDVPHRTQCTYVHIRVCEERKVSCAPACSQGKYYSFSNKPHNINKMCTSRLL